VVFAVERAQVLMQRFLLSRHHVFAVFSIESDSYSRRIARRETSRRQRVTPLSVRPIATVAWQQQAPPPVPRLPGRTLPRSRVAGIS